MLRVYANNRFPVFLMAILGAALFLFNAQIHARAQEKKYIFSADAGYELYTVTPQKDSAFQGKSDTTLNLKISPIQLLYARLDAAIPFFFLASDFKYGVFSGGKTYTGRDASVDKSKKSYLFDLSGGVFGFESKLTLERFDFGQADYYTSAVVGTRTRDKYEYTVPFVMEKRQLDMKYHAGWRDMTRLGGESRFGKNWDWFLGYRYISFSKPAVVFTSSEVKDFNGKVIDTKYVGETLPQEIKFNTNLIGAGLDNFEKAGRPGFQFLMSLEFYFGTTNTKIYAVQSQSEMPRKVRMTVGCVSPGGTLGFAYMVKRDMFDVIIRGRYGLDYYDIFIDKSYSTEYDQYLFQRFTLSAAISF